LFFAWVAVAVWVKAVWLVYPLIAFVWVMLILYAAARFLGSSKQVSSQLPRWVMRLHDIGVLALFIYGGWYITAVAYIASCIIHDSIGEPVVD